MRRWETERGLPVRRMPGSARGVVYAFTHELEEWLRRKQPAEMVESGPTTATPSPIAVPDLSSDSHGEPGSPGRHARKLEPESRAGIVKGRGQFLAWAIAVGLAIVVLASTYYHRQTIRFAARAEGSRWAGTANGQHVPSPEAQDLYLKGRYYWSKRDPEDLNKAVDYFTQAIVKDPAYAGAFVGLADSYNLLREFSAMPAEEAYPRALAAAQKAVELDPLSPEAHNSLAFVTFYWNWDAATAEREFKRALKLNPDFVQGHHWYATFLLVLRRIPEALDQIEQARQLDPSSTTILADKGFILWQAGREKEAVALLKQLAVTDPALATTHHYLSRISLAKQDYASFLAGSKRAAELRNDRGALAVAEAAQRGFDERGVLGMQEEMLPVQEKLFAEGHGSAFDVALTCAALGKNDEALRFLQTAFDKRETEVLLLEGRTNFSALQANPGYRELVAKIQSRVPQSAIGEPGAEVR